MKVEVTKKKRKKEKIKEEKGEKLGREDKAVFAGLDLGFNSLWVQQCNYIRYL